MTTERPKKSQFDPFLGPEIERVIYTTQSQEEIWADCLIGGPDANRAYNLSISLYLTGELNLAAMKLTVKTMVERHESLRAIFSTDGHYMTIFKELDIKLDVQDFSSLNADEKDEAIAAYLHEDAYHIFDLVNGPLMRVGLIKVEGSEHQLVLTAHHIICDGWSLGIMIQELGGLYSAYVANKNPELPEPERFSTFADGRQSLIESEAYSKIEDYWLDQYQESIPQLELPTDFQRPAQRTYKSNRIDFAFDKALLASLKKTGLKAGCSFVTTLMAAFEVFLNQLTGQDDLVIGLPAAGQTATGMEYLVGDCVNLLPVRSRIDPNITFNTYLKKRKSYLLDAYEHQQLSFGYLLQQLAIARDPSRIPLVPVIFNIDLGMTNGVAFTGLDFKLKSNHRAFTTFEIFLNASGTQDNLELEWSYNKALFKKETIEKMMDSYEAVMRKLAERPLEKLGSITGTDATTAYKELNATRTPYPHVALHELLREQALSRPEVTAIKFNGTECTYGSLEEQANQLSHYLTAQGVESGDFIGVSLPRSPELIVILLALMRCGAAYLPLDPSYPRSRLEFMLEDSGAKYLVTTRELSTSFPLRPSHLILEDMQSAVSEFPTTPLGLAVSEKSIVYLLYTSGSTGRPKGVPVTHRNLVNFLCSMAKEPGIDKTDKLLSITTISFDIAGLELFLPLLKGATLVLADKETARDGRLLLELLEVENISMLQATPTTWQMLLDSGWKEPLALKALCGGEALPPQLARQLLERCSELWNMYGPTETTVWSAIKRVRAEDEMITVGRPIANTQVYLVQENNRLVMPGKIGEICIAGDGVALGYWKRADLTAEKFIDNPFKTGHNSILYRTGDLGRLLPNGEIECLGRIDQQVKIRGHRIELGEIEQALSLLEGVRSAAVSADSDRLLAHVVPNQDLKETGDLIDRWREVLKKELPPHLVPHEFQLLKKLPTTLNGKLDRKALSAGQSSNKTTPVCTSARSSSERMVAQIWKKCLGLDQVDIFSNFFEMGGHSLVAVRVMTLLEEKTGKRLPLSALFEYSTVEKLAQLLETDSQVITWDSLVPIKPNGNKPPLYIVHGAGLNVLVFNSLAQNMDDDQPVYGLQAKGLNDKNKEYGTIEEIAGHYVNAIIKANPEGPYALAGYSFGGVIAFEMAHQLCQRNKKVSVLGLLDTFVDPHLYHASPFRKKLASIEKRTKRRWQYLKEMGKSWKNAKHHFIRKKEYLLEKYVTSNGTKISGDELITTNIMDLEMISDLIMKNYHLVPRNLAVDLFRAKDGTAYSHDPTHLGWKKIALGGIHLHKIPGNHDTIFSPPNDQKFARILQEVLDRRHSEKE